MHDGIGEFTPIEIIFVLFKADELVLRAGEHGNICLVEVLDPGDDIFERLRNHDSV
jgi:hypothetical protein